MEKAAKDGLESDPVSPVWSDKRGVTERGLHARFQEAKRPIFFCQTAKRHMDNFTPNLRGSKVQGRHAVCHHEQLLFQPERSLQAEQAGGCAKETNPQPST